MLSSGPGQAVIPGIKGFVETSFVDWRGRISSVIFLGGCNLRCPYCHNAPLVIAPHEMEDLSLRGILERIQALRDWVDGVCITGGEPTLHPRLEDLVAAIGGLGFGIKLDTNGTRPEVLASLVEGGLLGAVSMDVKAPLRPEVYARCAGVPDVPLGAVRESIRLLAEAPVEVEFRTTVVPGLLHERDMEELALTLPPWIPFRVQPFRPGRVLSPQILGPAARVPSDEWVAELQERIDRIRRYSEGRGWRSPPGDVRSPSPARPAVAGI